MASLHSLHILLVVFVAALLAVSAAPASSPLKKSPPPASAPRDPAPSYDPPGGYVHYNFPWVQGVTGGYGSMLVDCKTIFVSAT